MGNKIKYNIEVAKRITYARKNNDFSQAVLADLMNTSRSSYSSYETGVAQMKYKKLILFCEITHVSLDFILKGTNKINNVNLQINNKLIAISKITKIINDINT